MIVKTEAVVLKSMRYRETSKIVTFYTREFGKVKGIAKGALGPKSKFGASLEPMTHVALILYKKERGDLHTVSECDIVRFCPRLQSSLEKISTALAILELLDVVMHSEEKNEAAFRLVLEVLEELNRATKNLQNVFYYFRLHLLDLMGFRPDFRACVSCKKRPARHLAEDSLVHFDPQAGGILCSDCSRRFRKRVRLVYRTIKALLELQHMSLSEVTTFELSEVSKNEMDEVLRTYTRMHVTGAEKLKTESLMKKLAV